MASGKIFLLASILVLLAIHNSPVEALSCHCGSEPCGVLSCQGGTVRDECGCCRTCAKVEGESCGGPWNSYGSCDAGLECKKDVTGDVFYDYYSDGICTAEKYYL